MMISTTIRKNNMGSNKNNNKRNPVISNNSLSDPWAGVAGGMAPPQQTSNDWGAGADVSIFSIVGCIQRPDVNDILK